MSLNILSNSIQKVKYLSYPAFLEIREMSMKIFNKTRKLPDQPPIQLVARVNSNSNARNVPHADWLACRHLETYSERHLIYMKPGKECLSVSNVIKETGGAINLPWKDRYSFKHYAV